MLQPGDKAPDFTATTTSGERVSLHDFHGSKNVVLYFYPKDDTPGCTIEACEFRDTKADYDELDAIVFGVSTDDQQSHQEFANKFSLNFPLLVDSDGTICDAYEVPRNGNYAARITYLIDNQGIIKKAWEEVNPRGHAAEVMDEIKMLGHS